MEIISGIWDVSIEFHAGNCYLIEAESGKGKSSLFSFLYGYRNDYQGVISFDDRDITSIQATEWDELRRKNLSLLFQDLRLFPELTAFENISLKNKLTKHKSKQEILEMLENLGIAEKQNERCATMSLGQQQRVAIVRSLCQPFDFLLLDEPISHLDDKNAIIAAQLIEQEAKKFDATVIISSIGKRLPLTFDKTLSL
jgi:ABC-type lipoprotein export system ATPase subunit